MGASAAYWIASAADQIYADEVSLIGSIGVLINSFGFVGSMEKMGVERRLYTAGENKGMLDPFSPAREEDVVFIKEQLNIIHNIFIDSVKNGRKGKLAENKDLYSGRFWSGEKAKELGLIDEFGDINVIARDVFKAPKIIDYTVSNNLLDRIAKKVGASIGKNLFPKSSSSVEFNVN